MAITWKTFLKDLIPALFILFSFTNTYADIYRYIDKDGVCHFTQVPVSSRYEIFINPSKTKDETDNSNSNLIKEVQFYLSELGYNPGPIDGIFGQGTKIAIKSYQLDHGMRNNGKIDKSLLRSLNADYILKKNPKKQSVITPKIALKTNIKYPFPSKILPPIPSNVSVTPFDPTILFQKVQKTIYVVLASNSLDELKRRTNIFQGSAVAVSQKLLLTNYHIVEERPYIFIVQGENFYSAKIAGAQQEKDMCVLEVEQECLTPISAIKKFDNLLIGEKVFTVGSPEGLEQTLGEGIISGLRSNEKVKLIQTSAPISQGSSGGGLFDINGNLIGITTFLLRDSQNLNFALAAESYW